ncbi:hypothetical protein A0128_20525 [Leptospira tipperaryensis]|uniref:PPE family protein n=1 Tax=Leptospira tipperaryensis TaxID=2564040 RepID=A0A1D7V3J1_9LEPT|nr:hypothetical protein [Leptospira tipperaryensis]AOP36402.1 hypothetical protein A0128_20525 [Leptospira tipperaryensis]
MKKYLKFTMALISSLFVVQCGMALTPRTTVKIPQETESEIFRLNLYEGEVKSLYGINIGILNKIEKTLVGLQIGIFNKVKNHGNPNQGNFYGVQTGLFNQAYSLYNPVAIQIALVNYLSVAGTTPEQSALVFQFGLWTHSENSPTKGLTIGLLLNTQESGNTGLNIGLINASATTNDRAFGLNLGGINLGSGMNVGIVNLGGPVSLGVLNYGSGFQVGLLNICYSDRSFLPFMFLINYCKS